MLSELYVVVRPEEKGLVQTAIESVVGGAYTSLPALGRGTAGSLHYGARRRKKLLNLWSRGEELSIFLPKIVFYIVASHATCDELLQAVASVLRAIGAPSQCARGFAAVSPIESVVDIADVATAGRTNGSTSQPTAQRVQAAST